MNTIIISGWRTGLQKVSLTKIIRSYTGLGLAEGKQCTDDVVSGKSVRFENLESEAAKVFLIELEKIGAIATIEELKSPLADSSQKG